MGIGVIADSHDNIPHVKKAVELFNSNDVAYIIHAGVYIVPFSLKTLLMANVKLIGIFGNNDGEKMVLRIYAIIFLKIPIPLI